MIKPYYLLITEICVITYYVQNSSNNSKTAKYIKTHETYETNWQNLIYSKTVLCSFNPLLALRVQNPFRACLLIGDEVAKFSFDHEETIINSLFLMIELCCNCDLHFKFLILSLFVCFHIVTLGLTANSAFFQLYKCSVFLGLGLLCNFLKPVW